MKLADVIDRVRVAEIIGDLIPLSPYGPHKLRGMCPVHKGAQNKASFSVDEERGFAHCFSCGVTWNKIELSMALYGLTKVEAAHYLAGLCGESLDSQDENPEEAKKQKLAAQEAKKIIAWKKAYYLHLWRGESKMGRIMRGVEDRVRQMLAMPSTLNELYELSYKQEQCYWLASRIEEFSKIRDFLRSSGWHEIVAYYKTATPQERAFRGLSAKELSLSEWLIYGGEMTPDIFLQLEREGVDTGGIWNFSWNRWTDKQQEIFSHLRNPGQPSRE